MECIEHGGGGGGGGGVEMEGGKLAKSMKSSTRSRSDSVYLRSLFGSCRE